MPVNMEAMEGLRQQSEKFTAALDTLVRERADARGIWIDYLRQARLSEFEHQLSDVSPRMSAAVRWPGALLGPELVVAVECTPAVLGVANIDVHLSFAWHQEDHAVVRVEYSSARAPSRHELPQFVSAPLEDRVLIISPCSLAMSWTASLLRLSDMIDKAAKVGISAAGRQAARCSVSASRSRHVGVSRPWGLDMG